MREVEADFPDRHRAHLDEGTAQNPLKDGIEPTGFLRVKTEHDLDICVFVAKGVGCEPALWLVRDVDETAHSDGASGVQDLRAVAGEGGFIQMRVRIDDRRRIAELSQFNANRATRFRPL